MLQYMQRITRRRNEDGASAVEYGLLVAAIAAIIVVIVFALGKLVKEGFTDTCTVHQDRLVEHQRQLLIELTGAAMHTLRRMRETRWQT